MIIVVGVLILGAGGYVVWQKFFVTPKNGSQQNATQNGVEVEQPGMLKAKLARAEGKDKITLYEQLIVSQQLSDDVQGAYATAKELQSLDPTAEHYAIVGSLASTIGKQAEAIEAYKKAIELSAPSEDPDERSDYNMYKETLKTLEEKR